MTDEMKRMLTEEVLGECLHDWKWIPGGGLYCTKCPIDLYKPGDIRYEQVMPVPQDRTFTTWQDLGDLKTKIVEMGEWDSFVCYCDQQWGESEEFKKWLHSEDVPQIHPFTLWLMNPERFPELVVGWWRERKNK